MADSPSRFPPDRSMTLPEKLEAAHRKQLIVDTKRALALGKSVHEFRADRASGIARWTNTIRTMMSEHGANDPIECLPAIANSICEHAVKAAQDEARAAARRELRSMFERIMRS